MNEVMRGVALVGLLGTGAAAAAEWETLQREPLHIRARERADGQGKELWAEGLMQADARDVASALRDEDSYRRWMPYVKESRVVSTGAEGSRVTYTRLELPVVSSRDYVCQVVTDALLAEDGTGRFVQRWWAVPDALPPRHGVVRLRHNEGRWEVEPRGEGRAWANYRFSVDPGGSIPGFLASLGQTDGVSDTWKAVEAEARARGAERQRKAASGPREAPSGRQEATGDAGR